MPAWGDIVNNLLLNRQQLQEGQLHMQKQALDILGEQQRIQMVDREDQANRQVLSTYLQGSAAMGDKSLDIQEGDTPVTVAQKSLRQAQQNSRQSWQLANGILQAGGSVALAERYITDARLADQRALTAQRELRLEQKEQSLRAADIAGGMTKDEEAFQAGIKQLRVEAPDMVDRLSWDKDAAGNPVLGETSKRTANTLAQSGMTEAQRIDKQIKMDDELRKQRDEQRKIAEDKINDQEKNARIANLQQSTKTSAALEAERKQKAEQAKLKAERAQTVASKEPSKEMVKQASAAIEARYEEKFDTKSLDAFAGDVAARANKIRADNLRAGVDVSVDEARQQAMDELDQFSKAKHESTYFGLGPDHNTRSYSRGREPDKAPEKAKEKPSEPGKPTGSAIALPTGSVADVRKALVVDQIYDTPKGRARWDGSKFIPVQAQ
jgi:hypothetical protein